MKFTLLTYDSILAHNAGYAKRDNAIEFAEVLTRLSNEFQQASGIDSKRIYFTEVNDSDWCRKMIILYAKVDKDWKPTEKTFVIGDVYDKTNRPELDKDFNSWVEGRGKSINNEKFPPQSPHSLYRTIIK